MSADRPSREVAYRIFAAEFDDADFTFAESDEERAPNYVVTPTGARINRLFVVGVLTEVEAVSDDVLRARIVDPTGAFVVYAGQYQPEALAFFERAEPPMFVAVTGKARTFEPDDSDVIYTSIRPESANEVTAETRDRWVVQTAEQTIDRIEAFAGALEMAERSDALKNALLQRGLQPSLASGIPKAIDHYETTTGYLAAMRELAVDAARVVAGDLDEVETPVISPKEGGDVALEFEPSLPESEYSTETAATADTEPVSETEPPEADADVSVEEPEPAQTESTDTPDIEADAEETVDAEAADPAAEPAEATEDSDSGEDAEPPAEPAEEPEDIDTDEMYELSEEERQEVEENFDVGFETGNEVAEAGEADIDTPEPEAADADPIDEEAAADAEADTDEQDGDGEAADEGSEAVAADEDDEDVSEEPAEPAEDVDLEDAVVEKMTALNDGGGAPRDQLIDEVSSEQGVSADEVEDAIQDALMGGRCYEPDDDHITPI